MYVSDMFTIPRITFPDILTLFIYQVIGVAASASAQEQEEVIIDINCPVSCWWQTEFTSFGSLCGTQGADEAGQSHFFKSGYFSALGGPEVTIFGPNDLHPMY